MILSPISASTPTQSIEKPAPSENVIFRILAIVAKSLQQHNESSRQTRLEINRQKNEHKQLSQTASNLTREMGWDGIKFMPLTLLASGLLLSPHESDHLFSRVFQDMCPKVEGLFTAHKRSLQQSCESRAQMLNTLISSDINNESSESSSKQKALELAQMATEGWRVASRG